MAWPRAREVQGVFGGHDVRRAVVSRCFLPPPHVADVGAPAPGVSSRPAPAGVPQAFGRRVEPACLVLGGARTCTPHTCGCVILGPSARRLWDLPNSIS